jgi:hypothetical protein
MLMYLFLNMNCHLTNVQEKLFKLKILCSVKITMLMVDCLTD